VVVLRSWSEGNLSLSVVFTFAIIDLLGIFLCEVRICSIDFPLCSRLESGSSRVVEVVFFLHVAHFLFFSGTVLIQILVLDL